MKQHYDILLVGAGLFNATLAYHFIKQNKSVLVVEKRNHIAGNCYDEDGYGGDTIHYYRSPHFPYLQQRGLGFCKPIYYIQQLHKHPDSKL